LGNKAEECREDSSAVFRGSQEIKREDKAVKKRIMLILMVSLVAMSLAITGCPPVPPVDPVVPVPPPAIQWVAQSSWPAGFGLQVYAEVWAERITEISGGRLEVTMHPSPALVPPLEVFDAAAEGLLDAAHTWASYWLGYDPAFLLFCGNTVGMTMYEFAIWLFQYGGWELWQELYAPHNLFPIPASAGGAEPFIWARRPIRTLEDLKGLKTRSSGLAMDILGRMGAAVVFLPGGEIVPALEKGVIDAADFTTIFTDVPLGFHEVAPYLIIGRERARSYTLEVLINLDSWEALPPDLREVVIAASIETYFRSIAYSEIQSMKGFEFLKEYGIEMIKVDEEVIDKMERIRAELLDDFAAKSPFFARVLESQRSFLASYRPFVEVTH
jgi:TRAP-type mannitol/chloroaromatic compound transport system substrate-binding protein